MSSYNEVNGEYANENEHLMLDILREEWGYEGIVITDWGGSNDHVEGVAARSNLEMPAPGFDSARQIVDAVNSGRMTKETLDICVNDLLEAILILTENAKNKKETFDLETHHALARKAAEESAVLLKNQNNVLPLKPKTRVALIGDFAFDPRYQGAGSSMVNPTKVESMEDLIYQYDLDIVGINRGYIRSGEADDRLRIEALDLAAQADVIIYCFGLDESSESEGLDRTHMKIPKNQVELLKALKKVNENIVGIMSAGAAVEMPWHNCCKGIIHGYLNGQAGAGAMLNILTGKRNPSGKLAETYPLCYEDTPAFLNYPSKERNSEYREGIFVGYRYYDTAEIPVQYPFGYGLSYTNFEYSEMQADKNGATFYLTNTGDRDGAEVAQLYVAMKDSKVFRPEKELKGFKKVFLKAGERKKVSILFDDKSFRYWNIKTNKWEIEEGIYQILIGANAADIKLKAELSVTGTTEVFPYNKEQMPMYYSGKIQEVEDKEFEVLLGHSIPKGHWSGSLTENDAICQMYYAKSRLARFIWNRLTSMKKKSEEKGTPNLNILFIYNMPFRGIAKMTGGAVSMEMVHGMVDMVNGHFFKGIKQIIKGYFRNSKENKNFKKKLH